MLINYLHEDTETGERRRIETQAEPVTFPGFENFILALVRDIDTPTFRIVETITGRALTGPQESAEEATATCAEFLKTIKPQQLGERIAHFMLGPGREE